MNRILKILPFLLLCAFALQVMPVAAQQQMFLQRTQQSAPPTAGLLDAYKGAAFAAAPDVLLYSTYSATDDIAGSQTNGQVGQWSVAVLRDFDDAIKSFTPVEVANGTANTWVQALGPSDGFVRRWYDQSVTALDDSNLNHADQSDPTKMPKLFDSSTGLMLENGKAGLGNWISSLTILRATLSSNIPTLSAFSVSIEDGSSSVGYLFAGNPVSNFRLARNGIGSDILLFDEIVSKTTTAENYNQALVSAVNGSTPKGWLNGNSRTFDSNLPGNGISEINIGNHPNNPPAPNGQFSGLIQSLIIYPSDQSANRTAIETAINNEYSIYP